MKSKNFDHIKTNIAIVGKTIIVLLLLAVTSCSKDSGVKQDPIFQLPPETQIGANTFGVTINGKVYIPRDPTGVNVGGTTPRGMRLLGGGIAPDDYTEIVVVDGASAVGFKMTIHVYTFLTTGEYLLKNSNFQSGIDSNQATNIFFKIWDNSISNYAYYGSVENEGFLKITRRDNGIFSGIFSGKFIRYDNPNEFITIIDGRFDINSATLSSKIFP